MENIARESVVFDQEVRGYRFVATYLAEEHKADALIEIFKDDVLVREVLWPAYKVWNIAAHFSSRGRACR